MTLSFEGAKYKSNKYYDLHIYDNNCDT